MNVQVQKRDGSLENFDQAKIARVVIAAGLKEEQGQKLSTDVTAWAKSLNQTEINSQQIRERVIEELKKYNSFAANLFSWYEKTLDGE